MARLLTNGEDNTKTAKGADDLGILSKILHLAPYTNAGKDNVCPFASKGCAAACLYRSGYAGVYPMINLVRIAKTLLFHDDQAAFLAQLVKEVAAHVKAADKAGRTPAVRLNGTSDIAWEHLPVLHQGREHPNIMAAFPTVQFYDYTKVITRLVGRDGTPRVLPSNYHLTFSLSECNDKHALAAMGAGFNVAVVLRVAKSKPLPQTWAGLPVIDGDKHDFRYLDPRGGHIVALRAKGAAIKDDSGFVREVDAAGFDDSRVFVPASLALARA